jgi:GTP 3',8-cyclase
MEDKYSREINYLRISITDRCNLRCVYCMPEEGIELKASEDILSFEEILNIVKAAVPLGIKKIRITGGEPLVRLGLTDFIKSLKAIPEIDDIALTTNATLLAKKALELKEAGLNRVNISLDTLKEDRFKHITRSGNLKDVWSGIEAAFAVGLSPVKINMVVMKGFNDDEIPDFVQLAKVYPLHVRFIELMPIGVSDDWSKGKHMSAREIITAIEEAQGTMVVTKEVIGNGPANYFQLAGAKGTIGFISALSNHFCGTCNRVRLTSEGCLRTCLHDATEIDLKKPLRGGAKPQELTEIIAESIREKPLQHRMIDEGWKNNTRVMSQIGG